MEITETQKPVAYGMKIFMNNKTIKEMRVKSIFQTLFVGSIAAITVSCANEETTNDTVCINPNGTTFTASDVLTRTSMQHVKGGVGKFFWETGDNIWVDNNGTLVKSNASNITATAAVATFQVSGSFTNPSYPVFYTGTNSTSGNEVTIPATQTQTAPDNTSHFGQSGDCGVATATRSSTGFKFKLEHKAAYLCFLPRCESASLGPNIYLTKIVVTSDNDIAGTYSFTAAGLSASPTSGGAKTITLETKGTAGAPGFKLDNTVTNIENNGAYMVVAPGTHNLTIKYYVNDPVTNVDACFTKTASVTVPANSVTDFTANITPQDFSRTLYWEWDAKKHYWDGYENSQPMMNGELSNDYPKSNTTPLDERSYTRWDYNHPTWSPIGQGPAASNTAINCPSPCEATWYVLKGDTHWDDETAWQFGKHLYKGGVWIKKKQNITGFSNTTYASSTINPSHPAVRVNVAPALGKPANAENDYFYLPALGQYGTIGSYSGSTTDIPVGNGVNTGSDQRFQTMGNLNDLGKVGYYWLNHAEPWSALYENPAYTLIIKKEKVDVSIFLERNAAYGRNYWTAE